MIHTCSCGKIFHHRQGLYRHKKECSLQKGALVVQPPMSEAEFQTKLVNTLKEVLPKVVSTNITNHHNVTNRITNNQINIFLNKQCADAMSIQQFAKQLAFTIDDVLLQKQEALVRVINKNLNPLKVTERPVHCTNVARRRWHVKDETEGWRKDDGSSLVNHVNNSLLQKSSSQFEETFPGWCSQTNKKDDYLRIITMITTNMEPKAEARVLTTIGNAIQLDNSNSSL